MNGAKTKEILPQWGSEDRTLSVNSSNGTDETLGGVPSQNAGHFVHSGVNAHNFYANIPPLIH